MNSILSSSFTIRGCFAFSFSYFDVLSSWGRRGISDSLSSYGLGAVKNFSFINRVSSSSVTWLRPNFPVPQVLTSASEPLSPVIGCRLWGHGPHLPSFCFKLSCLCTSVFNALSHCDICKPTQILLSSSSPCQGILSNVTWPHMYTLSCAVLLFIS